MDKKDDFSALKKVTSHDSTSSSSSGTRRRSIGSNWLKKLQNRFGNDDESVPSRKNSVSSINSDEEANVSRSLSFKSRFRRPSTSSVRPSSPKPVRTLKPEAESLEPEVGSLKPACTTLAELERHKITTKAVGFALSTFNDNPPQRIPPASPETGNVEFVNGDVYIHKRVKGRVSKDPPRIVKGHADITKLASLKAAQNAERLHGSLNTSGFSLFKSSVEKVEDEVVTKMAEIDVDLTKTNKPVRPDDDEEWAVNNTSERPPPDQVYIRCCHLREIMPIRNILRQLQGQVAPIPRLRIANTKPTLVEIQAFSDFISVVPVAALSIDNHILTDEMVRLLLVGLTRSKDICRLSFVNTQFGESGWQYLCSYLGMRTRSLLALSLSCTNPTGVPAKVPVFDRQQMDWGLFTEALSRAGTLEELDLGGTKIPFASLQPLLEHGFKPSGQILGLANNSLSHSEVKFVADWAQQKDTRLMGINLSGNDLSRQEDRFILQQLLTNERLVQLSMRNARLTSIDASHFVQSITPEQASKSALRQLDLSYNPKLFPDVLKRLFNVLPAFPYLSRLQLEGCGLTSDMIISLCESLSHCHRLVFVNFKGNEKLNRTAASALCVAVHLSRSICTVEADLDDSDAALRQQLASYCFQNLENNTGVLKSKEEAKEEDVDENADITSFYDDLVSMRKYLSEQPTLEDSQKLVDRIDDLRGQIRTRLQSILAKRKVAPPTTQDRVSAIRLIFYASSLDKLKKEITGVDAQPAVPSGEEMVKNVDESDLRPVLKRQASEASIRSLKQLEREEGESHKAYADTDLHLLDDVGNLKVQDLEELMN